MQAEVVFASRAAANHRTLGVIAGNQFCHGAIDHNTHTQRIVSEATS